MPLKTNFFIKDFRMKKGKALFSKDAVVWLDALLVNKLLHRNYNDIQKMIFIPNLPHAWSL